MGGKGKKDKKNLPRHGGPGTLGTGQKSGGPINLVGLGEENKLNQKKEPWLRAYTRYGHRYWEYERKT